MTMMTKVMMTMMAMSDGWSVKGNQRGGHSIAALREKPQSKCSRENSAWTFYSGRKENSACRKNSALKFNSAYKQNSACRTNSVFWDMFPSKSKHIKRARRTLIPSQNLLPKAFQPVYIAMHCSACSSRQVYRKCSENSSCGQNYVENGPLFNHFDFGDTLLCAEALLTSTLSLLPPQSAAYANRCQLFSASYANRCQQVAMQRKLLRFSVLRSHLRFVCSCKSVADLWAFVMSPDKLPDGVRFCQLITS